MHCEDADSSESDVSSAYFDCGRQPKQRLRRQGGVDSERKLRVSAVGIGRGIAMYSRSLRAATAAVAFLMAGCHQLQSDYNDFLTTQQNNSEAFWAWASVCGDYKDQVYYIYDFGDGFKAGYAQILAGGLPCPPTLPPEKYWYIKYQTTAGRERIDAWFAGHEAGVATAMQDGVQDENKIPLSPYRRAQMQGQHGCPTCYPPMGTAPAMDYEAVPPTPALEEAVGEPPLEFAEPVTEAEMEEEAYADEEMVSPVNYHFTDEVTDQE